MDVLFWGLEASPVVKMSFERPFVFKYTVFFLSYVFYCGASKALNLGIVYMEKIHQLFRPKMRQFFWRIKSLRCVNIISNLYNTD